MSTMFVRQLTETFYVVSCYSCGIPFGIEAGLYRRVVTDAVGSVFCPACGEKTCWRQSEDQKRIADLERKLQWEAAEAARQREERLRIEEELMAAKGSLRSTQGAVTRLKRRAAAGVCPCCNRTFRQLARHMEKQHPDYGKKPDE